MAVSRLANLRVGQLREIGNGAIFGSMITYKRLVKMGQKSQAFLTQMVQFWWGNCVSHSDAGRVGGPNVHNNNVEGLLFLKQNKRCPTFCFDHNRPIVTYIIMNICSSCRALACPAMLCL